MAKIAYYCRFAAVDQGIRLVGSAPPAQQAAANAFLEQLFGRVEADKAALGIRAENEAADLAGVRNFALRVFKTADDADRAGLGSADTARSFVAVGNLLDVVRSLSGAGADPKLGEISKYAKGRSVEILKAVKEGRPAPPPPDNGAFFDVDAELAALGAAPPTSSFAAAAAAVPAAAGLRDAGSGAWSLMTSANVATSSSLRAASTPSSTPTVAPSTATMPRWRREACRDASRMKAFFAAA